MRWLRRFAIDVRPLRSGQFRLLWLGAVVSAMGSQFSRVGLYVQVYALTGSAAAVGLLGLSGLVGSLAGVFVGSAFIDRYDRRTTLIWTQLASIVVAAILFFGALSGHPPLWLLHAANLGTWFLAAIHGPARQAAIPRLLSEEEIPAASALNQAGWQVGSIVGPALAGVVIAVSGVAWAYGVDLASYVFSFVVALLLAPIPLGEEIVERGLKAVAEGLQYLRNHRLLQSTFVIDLVAMIFGSPQALYPVIAAQQLHRGPEVVGLLFAAPAAGALLMTLASGSVTGLHRQGDAIVWAVVAWGAAITGFGLSGTHLVPALVCLAVAGAADVVSAIFRSTILQVTVPDRLRGRLASIFMLVVAGGPKLGDLEAGLVASAFTPTVSVVSGGVACIVGAFVCAAAYPELRRYRSQTARVGGASGAGGRGVAE
jgi:MFS family permease